LKSKRFDQLSIVQFNCKLFHLFSHSLFQNHNYLIVAITMLV